MITQFSDSPQRDPSRAKVHLLPVPLERSVSYGGGTSKGPGAILEASFQLENYDREFDAEPGPEYGIYTYPAMDLAGEGVLESIADRVEEAYHPDKLLGVLGGEHSLTAPVVEGLLRKHDGPLTVVQLDAHCDLRDRYEDDPHSHACVSRRLLEQDRVEQILQFGIRSLCLEEARLAQSEPRVGVWYTEQVHSGEHLDQLATLIRGKDVYLTLDVDCFDPSIVPSTGTPEPNGMSYLQAEEIVRVIIRESRLVAFDCVELAPIPNFHAPDFLLAKFLYKLMNLRLANP